ncbi:MAG: rhodanese-like domain-containing protein [Elusimicrobia bacterium]|nr:rhodanese-like domain-containing protein [Elusimicrobiota bacterium]
MIGIWEAVALGAGVMVLAAVACSRTAATKPNVAAELAKDPGTFILDVRSEGEFAQGHLERAVLIPIQQLPGRLQELPAEKRANILVYCAMGGRSAVAASLIKARGYASVHDLSGGIRAWENAGLPVVK